MVAPDPGASWGTPQVLLEVSTPGQCLPQALWSVQGGAPGGPNGHPGPTLRTSFVPGKVMVSICGGCPGAQPMQAEPQSRWAGGRGEQEGPGWSMGHCPGRGIRRGPLLSPPGGSRPYFFFCSSVIVACNLLITVSSSRVHGLEIEYWKNSCNPSRGSFRRRSEDKHAIRPTGAPLGRFSPHPGAFPWGQQTRSAGPRRTKAVSHPAAGPILAPLPGPLPSLCVSWPTSVAWASQAQAYSLWWILTIV